MHIKKMLQINIWFSVVAGLVILLVLFLSLREIKSAMEEAEIAGDIISATFERVTFRNDYLQRNNERAKEQWFAKHAQIGGLLDVASKRAWSADNKMLVGHIIEDYSSVGTLFSTIAAGRNARQLSGSEFLSQREDRLLTQLVILSYDTVLHAGKLQESSREYLFFIIKLTGWSLVFVFVVVAAAVLNNSWSLQRLVADRIGKLREGAAAVGGRDLGYRIGLEGKDEFVELADAFDDMIAKLGQSYLDLEREVAVRRRGEEALRESEARVRAIFDNAGVGIVEVSDDDRFIAVNDRICKMLGYEYQELLSMTVQELTAQEDRLVSQEMNRRVHEGEVSRVDYDKRYLKRDGTRLWVHVNVSGIYGPQNQWLRSIATIEDISERKHAEEALREREETFRAIFEQAAVGMGRVAFDDACWIEVNEAFCRMLGYSAEEMRTIPWPEITHPDDVDLDLLPFKQMAVGELDSCTVEKRFIHKSGTLIWARLTLSLVRDVEGRPSYEIAIIENINEQKQAEEALRESEARFRGTFENAAVGIGLFDRTGRLKQANNKLCDILGYAQEELRGRSFESLTYPDDMEPDRSRYALLIRGELKSYEVEKRYIRKDGSTVWVRIGRSALLHGQEEGGYSISIVQDISVRKEVEEKLQRSRALLLEAESLSHTGAWEWDVFTDTWTFSEEWLNIHGVQKKMLQPDELLAITHPEDRAAVREGFDGVRRGVKHYQLEHRIIRQDTGELRFVRARGRFVTNGEGAVVRVYGFAQDVTRQKQTEEELRKAKDELEERVRERTEELQRAMEEVRFEATERLHAVEELRKKEQLLLQQNRLAAMGEMLVNISHQWRQPLNVLGLILQELSRSHQRGTLTGEFLETRVSRGKQVISHMSHTIDDFRNFLNPDKIVMKFNVKDVVETTLSMLEDSFRETGVEVKINIENDISIEGFRNEYAQAVMNILINARDVLRDRKIADPRLTITISKRDGKSVVIFADNGGGISGEIIDKIFDPYFTTKTMDKGTGIGLFMSKMIIEKNMNGTLSASNVDEGALFRIEV